MTPSRYRVAIYARVSTKDQTAESQLRDLRELCARKGWTDPQEFVDEGISGTKRNRPRLDAMMDLARHNKLEAVLVWKFDRFARSLRHLVETLQELKALNVDFVSYQEAIDTTTPMGKLIFHINAAYAEFEREIIRDRVLMGLRRAKENGVTLGRPVLPPDTLDKIRALSGQMTHRLIAAQVGVSKTTVTRVLGQKPLRFSVSPLVETPL